jgi:hypothetical protein
MLEGGDQAIMANAEWPVGRAVCTGRNVEPINAAARITYKKTGPKLDIRHPLVLESFTRFWVAEP